MAAADLLDRAQHRLGEHHHPRPAAVGLVVRRAMAVAREVAEVVHAHVEQSLLDAARDHPLGDERIEHPRKDRDEVKSHR